MWEEPRGFASGVSWFRPHLESKPADGVSLLFWVFLFFKIIVRLKILRFSFYSVSLGKMCTFKDLGASLVAQWLRIRLPMQGTWVRALVWEDPTCRGATKPVCHSYWACALEPVSHNYWVYVPQLLKPARLEPMLRNKRSHRNEKPVHRNEE